MSNRSKAIDSLNMPNATSTDATSQQQQQQLPAIEISYWPWSRHPPDTPQAVSIIGFLLGALFVFGLSQAVRLIPEALHDPGPTGLWKALHSPLLGAYLAALAIFHMSEYLTTAIWNPSRVKVGSYLLHNGLGYHCAHIVGVLEFMLCEAYLPITYRKYKHVPTLIFLGLGMTALGQYARSLAMVTAASNFSHDVAHVKASKHELVTNGIYNYSRHPSYAAFLYWAVGTQVMLGNPVSCLAFIIILWHFFSTRIYYEELALLDFFGKDYEAYRKRVGTGIPFIK